MSIWGNPVMMMGSGGGGGGIQLLTRAEWNALPTEVKQAYGLVAIQDAVSGFDRGELVYGGDYSPYPPIVPAEMAPIYSWCASDNSTRTYNFASTTLGGRATTHCMAVMLQNGRNPAWNASANLLPALREGVLGNGSYALCYGEKASNDFASTYSGGDNWNNSEIACFCLSGDINPTVKELFFEQGGTGTYSYAYTATSPEELLLIAMRGGNSGGSYSVSGLTRKSHTTASGVRFVDVYYDAVESGDTVSISIPYAPGSNNNGALLVMLMSVGQ